MIKVKFRKQGFEVSGHALFANPGDDIVCSAVSVTTIGVINEITRIVTEKYIVVSMDQEAGLIDFSVSKKDDKVDTLLNYFENTMTDVAKNYSKYIEIID